MWPNGELGKGKARSAVAAEPLTISVLISAVHLPPPNTFSANKLLVLVQYWSVSGENSHPVEHGPRGVRDGLHAQPRVAERVAEPLLEPPDVAHQPRRRLRRHVHLRAAGNAVRIVRKTKQRQRRVRLK